MRYKYNKDNIKDLAAAVHFNTNKEQQYLITEARLIKNYTMDEEVFQADMEWLVDRTRDSLSQIEA